MYFLLIDSYGRHSPKADQWKAGIAEEDVMNEICAGSMELLPLSFPHLRQKDPFCRGSFPENPPFSSAGIHPLRHSQRGISSSSSSSSSSSPSSSRQRISLRE